MVKHRAILRMTISAASFNRGPERENDNKQAKLDLICLKENYPDFKEGIVATENHPFYKGDTDVIFEDETCDEKNK